MDFLIEPFYYNWLILGGIFLLIEVTTFTLLFMWLAMSAAIMAVISFIFPNLSLSNHLLVFAVLSVACVIIWHRAFKHRQTTIGDNKMNNRAQRYVGQQATLVEPIVNGYGKIRIEDSLWRVACSTDLPVEKTVIVTAADGVILQVKPHD